MLRLLLSLYTLSGGHMSFERIVFADGITYFAATWNTLQDNIGNYYDALIAAIYLHYDPIIAGIYTYYDPIISTLAGRVTAIESDYLTSAHTNSTIPHPNLSIDNILQGTIYKKMTAVEETNWNTIYNGFGGSPSMDNIPQGTTYKKITAVEETNWNTIYNGFGGSPSMDNIAQGSLFKKLSAVEYAKFLTGFYDILDLGTTIKFGQGRNIAGFYFACGADDDGADIYGNNLYSHGHPVYTLDFDSGWHQIASLESLGTTAHLLGHRPDFAILNISDSDPTGQPEDYISTAGYAGSQGNQTPNSYGTWNDTYYNIFNYGANTRYFQLLLFSFLGD